MEARNRWSDYAKGIGIILVVYGHVSRGVFNAGMPMDEQWFKAVDSIIYSFHMPLFFFLSGLFFYESLIKWGSGGLIVHKVDTIVYPYVVWSLLQGLCEVALSKYTNGQLRIEEVLSFAWQPRAQFWFLYALFLVFAVCSVLYAAVQKRHFLGVAALFGLLYLFRGSLPSGILTGYIASSAVFFALGIWCNEHRSWFEARSGILTLLFGVMFVACQFAFHVTFGLDCSVGGIPVLALATISIMFVITLSMQLCRTGVSWLPFIGVSSMAIFVMHILAGSGTRVVLRKIFGVESVAVHLALGLLAGVAAPVLASLFINRFRLHFLFAPPKFFSAKSFLLRKSAAT